MARNIADATVHIYTERLQPATRWTDTHCGRPMTFRWPGNRLLWCRCCFKYRQAKNCTVQSYYDGLMVWCAKGKGCEHPRLLMAKKRLAFKHRSIGQKMRWTKNREVGGGSEPA